MFSRIALLNLLGAALIGASWYQGWIEKILVIDTFHACKIITALFVVGIWWCLDRAYQLDTWEGAPTKSKLSELILPVRQMAFTVSTVGLIGTFFGVILALSSVDQAHATDASAVPAMVATLFQGVGISMYKSFLGGIFSLWLTVNYWMLRSKAVEMIDG